MVRKAIVEGISPGESHAITIRVEYPNEPGFLGQVASIITQASGDIDSIDLVEADREWMVRDVTINTTDTDHARQVIASLEQLPGLIIRSASDRVFIVHLGGKIEVQNRVSLSTRRDLSTVYTPGVARVSQAIKADPDAVWTLTTKKNTLAIVTDGSAVLGLGDIGPEAALPVMEGKAMLFKEFGHIDAWPICLSTTNPDEIVQAVKAIAPGFGGINLEDISAPRCFEIEERLRAQLDIPVLHADQHGTAIVVLAALINSLRLVRKNIESIRVCVCGFGAAGVACAKMLLAAGVREIVAVDRYGIVYPGRKEIDSFTANFLSNPRFDTRPGTLQDAIVGSDVFLGVSAADVITAADVKRMNQDPIVFALANPNPEIRPELLEGLATVVATGRPDYPNQLNNTLCVPGLFRGALDVRATEINDAMKLAAANALANTISREELSEEYIVPSVFNRAVSRSIARDVIHAAQKTGVARRTRRRPAVMI